MKEGTYQQRPIQFLHVQAEAFLWVDSPAIYWVNGAVITMNEGQPDTHCHERGGELSQIRLPPVEARCHIQAEKRMKVPFSCIFSLFGRLSQERVFNE
jgi:hypothetical protein